MTMHYELTLFQRDPDDWNKKWTTQKLIDGWVAVDLTEVYTPYNFLGFDFTEEWSGATAYMVNAMEKEMLDHCGFLAKDREWWCRVSLWPSEPIQPPRMWQL